MSFLLLVSEAEDTVTFPQDGGVQGRAEGLDVVKGPTAR